MTQGDDDTNRNLSTRYSHRMIGTGTEEIGNKRTSGDHPNYSTTEIGQFTEKGRGD